jgi:hypothetical protein
VEFVVLRGFDSYKIAFYEAARYVKSFVPIFPGSLEQFLSFAILLLSRKWKRALLESNSPGILDPTHHTDVSQAEATVGCCFRFSSSRWLSDHRAIDRHA